jgi:hypothetical protein
MMREYYDMGKMKLQRDRLLQETNEAYRRLKQDPKAWAEEAEERRVWENTVSDGSIDW